MRIWLVRLGIGLVVALILAGLGLGLAQSVAHTQTATLVPPPSVRGAEPRATVTLPLASTPTPGLGTAMPSVVVVTATVSAKTGLLAVTFHARQITGDYLFEPPVLESGGQRLAATAGSVERARLALLKLATQGEAQAVLEFALLSVTENGKQRTPVVPAQGSGQLIFNPDSLAGSLVAPRMALPVVWQGSKG